MSQPVGLESSRVFGDKSGRGARAVLWRIAALAAQARVEEQKQPLAEEPAGGSWGWGWAASGR